MSIFIREIHSMEGRLDATTTAIADRTPRVSVFEMLTTIAYFYTSKFFRTMLSLEIRQVSVCLWMLRGRTVHHQSTNRDSKTADKIVFPKDTSVPNWDTSVPSTPVTIVSAVCSNCVPKLLYTFSISQEGEQSLYVCCCQVGSQTRFIFKFYWSLGAQRFCIQIMGKVKRVTTSASPEKKARGSTPSVTDLGSGSTGRSLPKVIRSDLPANTIILAIMPYMKNGNLYHSRFAEGDLSAMYLLSSMWPNPVFGIKSLVEQDEEYKTFDTFKETYQCELSWLDKKMEDRDQVGFRKGATAFYVSTSAIKDLILYLDELWYRRVNLNDERFEPLSAVPSVKVYTTTDLSFDTADELKLNIEVVQEVFSGVTVFDLPPPNFPARVVTLTFEMVSESIVHIVFAGNLLAFSEGFAAAKVLGDYHTANGRQYPDFHRFIRNESISNVKDAQDKMNFILNELLAGVPVILRAKESEISLEPLQQVLSIYKESSHVRIEF